MTTSPLQKIDKAPQTLRDIVQDRMREAIIAGHFAPGERLVERPLCDQLGVSRTVIRETIRYLEAEGLVEIVPNRGPIVATLNWDQAKQIYDVRLLLEGAATSACTLAQSKDFGPKLTRALKAVEAKMDDIEWADLLQATTRFYELIFREAGHTVAWEIVQRLNGRISRLRALTIAARDRETSGMSHMTSIHDAILSHDSDAARRAVEAHISDAAKTAQGFLNRSEPEGKDA
ncbi:GntR family transcriptional regulator [Aliiroseovarius subalbicans]|uniref:GntR family transcriptional regulator n=1 Tax=Aliiroseovarius subalbicans TaxID=2925840 RepID=UPI001F593E8B|nr:GntR family transcriptional regulator [Aliiroseovarius subalbicans]MCI2397920.1 GntR family transcriptional regulator [Aliiroseovarius subalbicans]